MRNKKIKIIHNPIINNLIFYYFSKSMCMYMHTLSIFFKQNWSHSINRFISILPFTKHFSRLLKKFSNSFMQYSTTQVNYNLFSHSPIVTYLGYFQYFDTVNTVGINILIHRPLPASHCFQKTDP